MRALLLASGLLLAATALAAPAAAVCSIHGPTPLGVPDAPWGACVAHPHQEGCSANTLHAVAAGSHGGRFANAALYQEAADCTYDGGDGPSSWRSNATVLRSQVHEVADVEVRHHEGQSESPTSAVDGHGTSASVHANGVGSVWAGQSSYEVTEGGATDHQQQTHASAFVLGQGAAAGQGEDRQGTCTTYVDPVAVLGDCPVLVPVAPYLPGSP